MINGAYQNRARLRSGVAVALVHLLIVFALLRGLNVDLGAAIERPTILVDLATPAAPPPPPPESAESPDAFEEGGAAPPDLRAVASPVVAPEPIVEIPRPSPVRAAPEPNDGLASSQGAAEIPGPGTGAGGEGTGTGSGAGGNGPGGGFAATPARKVAGDIAPRDYPRAARRTRAEGVVAANLDIGADGRVTRCRVMRSSGNPDLDTTTCRLIRERFRYEPARDTQGRPVATVRGWEQRWWLERG